MIDTVVVFNVVFLAQSTSRENIYIRMCYHDTRDLAEPLSFQRERERERDTVVPTDENEHTSRLCSVWIRGRGRRVPAQNVY
jgi:hypothetical protein